jgi:hypothetical protein
MFKLFCPARAERFGGTRFDPSRRLAADGGFS